MNSQQNVHSYLRPRLWSNNMWLICLSHLLLSVSLYMLIPVLYAWLKVTFPDAGALCIGSVLAISGVATFLLGPFFNYLVDRFSRKRVCAWSIIVIAVCSAAFHWTPVLSWVIFLRIVQGMMQGVALMASGSTLAIDLTESPRRTEANNAFAWFGRLGLSLGPLLGLLFLKYFSFNTIFGVSCAIGCVAALLILMLKVPFRAPLCPPICSIDRFWLPNGWLMFIQILPVAAGFGMLLAVIRQYEFYVFMMVGFCLALIALHYVFLRADIRSEIVSGNILWGAGLLLLLFRHTNIAFYCSGALIGLGVGLTVARMLIFYIKLSQHCERGSANTSYMLAWELGLSGGLLLGTLQSADLPFCYEICLWMLIAALAVYLLITHRWFMKHKMR